MATTTKKSSRAKNQTTKKSATKSTRVSTSAKITKKATKSTKLKNTKNKVLKKAGSLAGQAKLLPVASVALFLGGAVAAGLLMKEKSYELTLAHLTRDDLVSQTTTVLGPATRVLYDIDIRLVLISILLLSAAFPLLYLTRLKRRYENNLQNKVHALRWVELAVTMALMLETVALLSGIHDVFMLKLMGGLIGATCALGWLAEKQNADSRKPVWSAYVISLVTGFLPWLAVAAAAIATPLYGMVRSPWYVYVLYVVTLGGFSLLALNQYKGHRNGGSDYALTDGNYVRINLLTKVAFAVVLIVGLLK